MSIRSRPIHHASITARQLTSLERHVIRSAARRATHTVMSGHSPSLLPPAK
jgi:hypothetical protein